MARLTYYTAGFQYELTEDNISLLEQYIAGSDTPAQTITNVLRFAARLTAKHELGHVLGFAHPAQRTNNSSSVGSSSGDSTPRSPGFAVVMPSYQNPSVPIMTAITLDYARGLSQQLGRQVTADDIAISPQEHAALDTLYEASQHHCSCCPISLAMPSGHKSFIAVQEKPVDSYVCPSFRFIPLNPAVTNLILNR